MMTRALEPGTDDWTFGNGRGNYLREQFAVAQNIKTRLRSFFRDCFFDMEAGIDWWTLMGGKNVEAAILAIKTTILETEGVTQLIELSVILDENRELRITYSVMTVYSTSEPIVSEVEVA